MKHTIAEIKINYIPKRLKAETIITNSEKAYEVFLEHWDQGTLEFQEEFKILLLNNSSEPLGIYTLSRGGITFTSVDLRVLFAVLLKSAATSFITAHNHPSGKLKPSENDKVLFNKIKKASKFLDIQVLDNLIITKEDYYSFADEGLI